MKMIEKLHSEGATGLQAAKKVNEIIDVVNALIDGEFPDSMDRIDFRLKMAENLRKAQSEVKN